ALPQGKGVGRVWEYVLEASVRSSRFSGRASHHLRRARPLKRTATYASGERARRETRDGVAAQPRIVFSFSFRPAAAVRVVSHACVSMFSSTCVVAAASRKRLRNLIFLLP